MLLCEAGLGSIRQAVRASECIRSTDPNLRQFSNVISIPPTWLLACASCVLAAYCCLPLPRVPARLQPPAAEPGVHYVDITRQAGINFVHYTGAFGKKYPAGDHGRRAAPLSITTTTAIRTSC